MVFYQIVKGNIDARMNGYVEEHEKSDPLIHPMDKKANPWVEKVSFFNLIYFLSFLFVFYLQVCLFEFNG